MLFHIERQPDLEPLPKAEQEVLLKALSKNPEDRYPSCSDFVAALETAVAAELGRTHLGSSLGSGLPAAAASGTVTNLGTLRPGEAAATLGHGAQGQAPWQTVGAPATRGSGWAVKA